MPSSLTQLASDLQALLRRLGAPPAVPTATVSLIPGTGNDVHLQISAVVGAPSATLTFTGALADTLGLAADGTITNVQSDTLGAVAAGAAHAPT